MENCNDDQYVFSRCLKPGSSSIAPKYFTDRWKHYVKWPVAKGGLGINVDLYSLKHLNLDETAAEVASMQDGIKAAAAMAGHATPVITLKYAQGEKDRQVERLKKIGNKFA